MLSQRMPSFDEAEKDGLGLDKSARFATIRDIGWSMWKQYIDHLALATIVSSLA